MINHADEDQKLKDIVRPEKQGKLRVPEHSCPYCGSKMIYIDSYSNLGCSDEQCHVGFSWMDSSKGYRLFWMRLPDDEFGKKALGTKGWNQYNNKVKNLLQIIRTSVITGDHLANNIPYIGPKISEAELIEFLDEQGLKFKDFVAIRECPSQGTGWKSRAELAKLYNLSEDIVTFIKTVSIAEEVT